MSFKHAKDNNEKKKQKQEDDDEEDQLLSKTYDDDDQLLTQAYDDFLMANIHNNIDLSDTSRSTQNAKNDEGDLITLEDLLGIPSTSQSLLNLPAVWEDDDVFVVNNNTKTLAVVKPLRELALAAANQNNMNHNDNDLTDSSFIATVIVLEIFDRAYKTAKQSKRWNQPNPGSWKINVAKKRRAEDLPYVIKKKARLPKVPKPVDCTKCHFACQNKVNEETRRLLCRKYWNFDYVAQKNFILSNIDIKQPKFIKQDRKRATNRSCSTQCFFKLDGVRNDVCQKFFRATLCIGQCVIYDAIRNRDVTGHYGKDYDSRGKHVPVNKTSDETVQYVDEHIRSFPSMESHYVRKDSQRQYLDCKLSIGKMYRLYCEKCTEDNKTPVSESTYRRIFGTNFHLDFFTPKKDQCLICTRYARANENQKSELEMEYQEHLSRKVICNEEKKKDKERANNDENFVSVTFDLQAILQIPSGDIGILYYVRKLTCYNLTIYESALPNRAYCFTWSEIHGKKGSCEIGTILLRYLSQCVPENVTEVSLFSDTCGGQNRNKNVAAVLLWAVNNIEHLKQIEQKFLESGHTYMEADSMHSAIEREQKNTAIYSMSDWINVFKKARSKEKYKKDNKTVLKERYQVKEFKYHEFKNLKDLSEKILLNTTRDTEGKQVKWLKIKRLKYIKGETKIFFNYDMSEKFSTIDISRKFSKNETPATSREAKQPIQHVYSTRNKNKMIPQATCSVEILPENEVPEQPIQHGYSTRNKNKMIPQATPSVEIQPENEEPEQPIQHGYSTRNKNKTIPQATSSLEIQQAQENEEPYVTKYFSEELKQLYKAPIKISAAKKRDLLQLCNKGVIPEELHPWFHELQTDEVARDRLPDVHVSEEESDSEDSSE